MADVSITEPELRAAARHLLPRLAKGWRHVFEELQIEQGAARVDLALVSDGSLEAFELKSDADNFGRLHNQIHAYGRVFDRVSLITGPAHMRAAVAVLPPWWGVACARRTPTGLDLEWIRVAQPNPALEPFSVATLLWRDEAIDLLRRAGNVPPARANRTQLYAQLAASVPLDEIRASVRASLRRRSAPLPV